MHHCNHSAPSFLFCNAPDIAPMFWDRPCTVWLMFFGGLFPFWLGWGSQPMVYLQAPSPEVLRKRRVLPSRPDSYRTSSASAPGEGPDYAAVIEEMEARIAELEQDCSRLVSALEHATLVAEYVLGHPRRHHYGVTTTTPHHPHRPGSVG